MTPPKLRLAFGAVFWRIFLLVFVFTEIIIWNQIRLMFPGAWKGQRIPWLLYLTPRSAFQAFAIAAFLTMILDQFVRLIARPLVARWYAPFGAGSEDTPIGFHLAPGESVLAEAPARRRVGRGWSAGTLVLTERFLWFFPLAWDLEPWSIPLEDLRTVATLPYRPIFGTFVRGVPDRLIVRDAGRREESFALADPAAARDWFRRPGLAPSLRFPTIPDLRPALRESPDA